MRINSPSEFIWKFADRRRFAVRAFTLVEMMTVMVIIGIATAMIIPEMKGTLEDALLRSTARELVNLIELASSRAISLNQTVHIKLDPSTGRYEVERKVHQGFREEFEPLKDVAGTTGKLDTRIALEIHDLPVEMAGAPSPATAGSEAPPQIANPDEALIFNPDGTASGTLIMLKDRAGFRMVLRVNPITSRVSILEPKHE